MPSGRPGANIPCSVGQQHILWSDPSCTSKVCLPEDESLWGRGKPDIRQFEVTGASLHLTLWNKRAEGKQRRIKPLIKKIKTISQNYNTQVSRLKVSRNMQENRWRILGLCQNDRGVKLAPTSQRWNNLSIKMSNFNKRRGMVHVRIHEFILIKKKLFKLLMDQNYFHDSVSIWK